MKKSLLLLSVLFALFSSLESFAEEFVIARNGKALLAVVKNKDVAADQKYLLQEARFCGVELPLAAPGYKGKKILFRVRKNVPVLEEDAYRISFPDKDTMLIDCSTVSSRFAVNHILQKAFGIRYFFMPMPRNKFMKKLYSREINDYPEKKVVSLEKKTFRDDAKVKVSRYSDWKICGFSRNWNGKVNIHGVHMMCIDVFPVYKYAVDGSWPKEILPTIGGKKITLRKAKAPLSKNIFIAVRHYHSHWQPCWSDPATTRIAIENILEILKKDPSKKVINMDVNDNGGYCQCAACRKAVGNKRTQNNMVDYSALYWKWVNDVANAVTKHHPHVIFSAIAYREVITPPAFKLNKNIIPRLCVELVSMVNNKEWKEKRMKLFGEWSRKASALDIYDYIHGSGHFGFPRIYFREHARILADLVKNHKLQAAFFESDGSSAFQGPYQQLLMRLLWDPDLDVEKFLKEWCREAVGEKAAPHLLAYYDFWEKYWSGEEIRKTAWYDSVKNVYMQLGEGNTHMYALQKGDMKYLRSLMEKVVALAGTKGEKKRAQALMESFEYAELAARTSFAELIPADGTIRTAEEALALLKAVPESLRSAGMLKKHPMQPTAKEANMSNKIISASISSLSKIIPFMKDPLVRKELSRLARDKSNAHILRAQFQIWLGAKAKNLIENGSLEKPFPMVQPIWSSRLAGERSTKFASDGKYSFCARNGYFRFRPAVRPRKTYLFLCDIYMEKGSNEGRFTFQLGPCRGKIPMDWRGEKDQILTGGSWNTYSCVIPTGAAVDNIDIQLWFRYFERDERIYFDNVRLYDLEELK